MTKFQNVGIFIWGKVWLENSLSQRLVIFHTYPPRKRQSVPKRRHIKFRRLGITQKKAYNIQKTAKV